MTRRPRVLLAALPTPAARADPRLSGLAVSAAPIAPAAISTAPLTLPGALTAPTDLAADFTLVAARSAPQPTPPAGVVGGARSGARLPGSSACEECPLQADRAGCRIRGQYTEGAGRDASECFRGVAI